MARITDDNTGGQAGSHEDGGLTTTIEAFGHEVIDLPGAEFVKDANISRDGQDLVLEGPAGMTVIIEGYFNAEPAPMLTSPDGTTLTPKLVNSFVSEGPDPQYSQLETMSDASPVGSIEDISGAAHIIRTDGSVEPVTLGTAVYQGDVIETEGDGAVNIVFIDESTFAISENAKMAIDEFVFNPGAETGSSNFSILRGIFMFTSGLIGRDDPDDVEIDTPHGSIGIRGTTIAGNADTGEITVLEGAIVLRGFGGSELTLARQFETAKFDAATGDVIYLGKADSQTLASNFDSMKGMAPSTFIAIEDGGGDADGFEPAQVAGTQDQTTDDDGSTETTQTAALNEDTTDGEAADGTAEDTADTTADGEETTTEETTEVAAEDGTTDDGTADTTSSDGTTDTTTGDDTIVLASNDTGGDTTNFDGTDDTSFDGTDTTFDSTGGDTTTSDTGTTDTTTSDTTTSGDTDTTTTDTSTSDTTTSDTTDTSSTTDPVVFNGNVPVGDGGDIGAIYGPLTQQTIFANGSVLPTNIDVAGRFTDADGDITGIEITGIQQDGGPITPPAWITDGGGGLINFGPIPDAFMPTDGSTSTISIRVTATDSNGNTGSAIFSMNLFAASAPALQGTAGGEALTGSAANEVVVGLGGNDAITLSGADTIGFGGTGGDIFTMSGFQAKAIGEGGNDTFDVNADNTEVFGGTGDDVVNASAAGTVRTGGTFLGGSEGVGGDTISYAGLTADNISVTLAGLNFTTVNINGGAASDLIRGFENVTGAGGNDSITGDARNNVLDGGAGDDVLAGGGGDDILIGGTGDDTLNGGLGNDALQGGGGDDLFINSAGTDSYDGGTTGETNGDTIDFSGATGAIDVDLSATTINNDGFGNSETVTNVENIVGSDQADTITGDAAGNNIDGGLGNDDLDGGAGNDTINGGGGDNILSGGAGSDNITGGAGNDTYIAVNGDGNDFINDSGGNDIYDASAVTGTMLYGINGTTDQINGFAGTDSFTGGAAMESFLDGSGDSTFTVNVFNRNLSFDGNGHTTADTYVNNSGSNVTVTLTGAAAASVTDGTYTHNLADIEQINGGSVGNETFLINDATANIDLDGGAGGTDVLQYNGTGDFVVQLQLGIAGYGAETINITDIESFIGASGNDTFTIENAVDGGISFDGQGGIDTYRATAQNANTTFDLTTGNIALGDGDTDTVLNVEIFEGGSANDTFIAAADGLNYTFDGTTNAGAGNTVDFSAGAGAITVDLSDGTAQTIGGGFGDYTLLNIENVTGTGFDDNLTGNASNNDISAGAGDDTVFSSDGSDTYDGGAGIDTLDFSAGTQGAQVDIGPTFDLINNDGFGNLETVSVTGFESVVGTAFSDNISGEFSGTHTLSGMDGADTFEITTNAFVHLTDGDNLVFDGGNGMDALEFGNVTGGNFDINPDGVEDTIDSVETYDFALNAQSDNIDVNIRNFMLDNNTAQALDINVDDADALNLDFIAGGYSYDSGSIAAGDTISFSDGLRTVNVNFGGGFSGTLNVTGLAANTALNLNEIAAGLNNTDGFAIIDDIGEGFGNAIGSIGDQNGDGFDDVALLKSTNPLNDARAFLLSGASDLNPYDTQTLPNMTAGNTNADANTDIILQGGLMNIGASSNVNNLSFDFAGDFNGDGVTDYIVGAPQANSAANPGSGNAQIIDGDTGNVIVEMDGMAAFDETGASVAGIGDVNGDGFADVLIGAPRADGSGTDAGTAYLLFGDTYTPTATVNVTDMTTFNPFTNPATTDPAQIAIEGDYAFVVSPSGSSLEAYDITNPSAVSIPTDSFSSVELDGAQAITVVDGLAYIAAGTGDRISIFDVSDPGGTGITLVGTLQDAANLDAVTDIAVEGGYAFLTSTTANKMSVIDVTDPASPSFVTDLTDASISAPSAIALSEDGSYAFIGSPASDNVTVVDINNPNSPVVDNVIPDANFNGLSSIEIHGDLMFVTAFTADTLSVYDISDPTTPSLLDNITGAQLDGAKDVAVHDGLAYVTSNNGDAVTVVNVSDPSNLQIVDSYADGFNLDGASGIVVDHDGVAYVLGQTSGTLNPIEFNLEGIQIDGLATGDLLGTDVSGAGDVNGDGLSDFLISMPTSTGGAGIGTVYLVYGRDYMNDVDLTNTDHAQGITGIDVDATELDIGIEYMGDMDGGGQSDFVIVEDNGAFGDRIRLFYGESLGGPGSAAINVTSADMTIHTTAGELIDGGFGGDFNGDGFDDGVVVVNDGSNIADIYVIYGNSGLGASVDVATDLDATNSFRMTYDFSADNDPANFDFIISSAGDLNGDGFEDISIGLPDADNTGTDDGTVITVYGEADGSTPYVFDADDVDDGVVNATAIGDVLIGDETAETMNQNGFTDLVFRGGAGDDTIAITDASFAKIDGGGGVNDLIGYEGGARLDLRSFTAEDIQRIEGIDLGADGSTLLWSDDNVMNLLSSSDNGSLTIFNSAPADDGIILFEDSGPFDHPPRAFEGTLGIDDFAKATDSETAPTWDMTLDGAGTVDYTVGGGTFSIAESFFLNGNIIIGNNFVQDNDVADGNAAAGDIDATANQQTLIGDGGINNFFDGGFTDVSMFGLGGDDVFTVSNGDFDVIDGGTDGGTGLDIIDATVGLDLRSFDFDEIKNIEEIEMNFSGQTLTLSMQSIFDMTSSSETNILTIDAVSIEVFDELQIDVAGAGGGTNRTAAELAADAGWTHVTSGGAVANGDVSSGNVHQFDVGGGQMLYIDDALFGGGAVTTV